MQRKFIFIFSILLLTVLNSATAQKSTDSKWEVTASVDLGINEGYFMAGLGASLNYLIPLRQRDNDLVISAGIDNLFEDVAIDAYSYGFAMGSIGYRKQLRKGFIQPSVGFGVAIESSYISPCALIGIGYGIERKKFIYSIDYRFLSADGILEGEHFHVLGLNVGYKLTWKKK